jgi:hypothetical protein
VRTAAAPRGYHSQPCGRKCLSINGYIRSADGKRQQNVAGLTPALITA